MPKKSAVSNTDRDGSDKATTPTRKLARRPSFGVTETAVIVQRSPETVRKWCDDDLLEYYIDENGSRRPFQDSVGRMLLYLRINRDAAVYRRTGQKLGQIIIDAAKRRVR